LCLRPDGLEYGRLQTPSRLSATLRPLTRRYAALTAVLAGQDNPLIRAKAKRKIGFARNKTIRGNTHLHKIADTPKLKKT